MFEQLFEEVVTQCLAVGLVRGDKLSVDGTFVEANASKESRIPREQLSEAAQVNRTVREYLAELALQNSVEEPTHSQDKVSIHMSPNQITDVLLTHAHDDHMGGLVHNGQLVFPQAIVHLSAPDLAFFLDRSNAEKAHYAISYFDQAYTALKPEQDAGKIVPFHSGEEVVLGVEAVIHPGHTPGSTFYILRSRGQSIIFVGDIIHVAAVQAPDPKITIAYDVDPAKAAAVREASFAEYDQERYQVCPALPALRWKTGDK